MVTIFSKMVFESSRMDAELHEDPDLDTVARPVAGAQHWNQLNPNTRVSLRWSAQRNPKPSVKDRFPCSGQTEPSVEEFVRALSLSFDTKAACSTENEYKAGVR